MLEFSYIPNSCPLCGNTNGVPYHKRIFQQGIVNWVCCPEDGLIYQSPRLDNVTIHRLFDSAEYSGSKGAIFGLGYHSYFDGEAARLAMGKRKIIEIEKKTSKKILRILEIGCATGSFLKSCKDRGHLVKGIDASKVFSNYGMKNYDLNIDVGLFEEIDYSELSFDVVTIFGSLSSLHNPLKVFKKIKSILSDGGILVFNTPVLDSLFARIYGKKLWMFRPSGQVLYTKKTVLDLLTSAGLNVVENKRDVQAISLEKLSMVSGVSFFYAFLGTLRSLYFIMPVPSVIQVTANDRGG